MTKQETIAKAYGEHWETVKDFVDENGLIRYDNYKYFKLFLFDRMVAYDSKGVFWIPKSLKGIENNNGWIKIESEADLPKKGTSCHVILKSGVTCVFIDLDDSEYLTLKNRATHYKPIIKPQPPIY